MADNFIQGRRTIRRSVLSSVPGNPMAPPQGGRQNRSVRLWDLGDGKLNSTKEKLRNVYHAGLASVDRMEAHKADIAKSGRFTETGVNDEALRFAASDLAPSFHRGRLAIKKAREEAQTLRGKI